MKKSELKEIIKECLKELSINESLPIGKSERAREVALKLNQIVGSIQMPNLAGEARKHAAEIINIVDKDSSM